LGENFPVAYQVAIGYNQAGALADISVQPKTPGLSPGVRDISGDGLIYEDGFKSTTLEYGFLTAAQFNTLLGEFGLSATTASAKVTIRIPNDARSEANYNAIIVKPDFTREGQYKFGIYRDVKFKVRRLDAL
jgi:hypothetical protein